MKEDGARCMRDEPQNKGRCPVADTDRSLIPPNDLVVTIYNQAAGSSKQVNTNVVNRTKTYLYLRPADIESLMKINRISEDKMPEIMRRVIMIQDIANNLRPSKSSKKGKRR